MVADSKEDNYGQKYLNKLRIKNTQVFPKLLNPSTKKSNLSTKLIKEP